MTVKSLSGSDEVARIAQDVWDFRVRRETFLQLRTGTPVTYITGVNLAQEEEAAAFASKILARLDAVPGPLGHEDRVTAAFLRYGAELAVEAPKYHYYASPASPYATHLLSFYADRVFADFTFAEPDDGDRYLELLHSYCGLITDIGDKIQGQTELGIYLPKPALPGAIGALAAHRAAVPPRLRPQADRLVHAGLGSVQGKADSIIDTQLIPAFDRVLSMLGDDYLERAPQQVGVGQYPGGDDYYRFAIRLYNTLDLEPDDIHARGLEQVAALTEQMAELRGQLGHTGTEAEFHERLGKEPALFASSPAEIEAKYDRAMRRLEPLIGDYFSVLPKAPYGVKRLDPALEAGMTYGIYEPPTPREPTGFYRYNGSQLSERSLLNATAIIYHELAPGHHFHIARQSENQALPRVRQEAIEFGAYNEGWAEYAASLADEMGLYTEEFDRYGLLAHQRFISQRLVVDTGMNVKGWTLEQGQDYMRQNTLESPTQIASETIRYSTGLPAQALGYRLGFLKFHELRNRMQSALGDAFDIRDFHETVLGGGALPLQVLEEHVDWTIEQQRPGQP